LVSAINTNGQLRRAQHGKAQRWGLVFRASTGGFHKKHPDKFLRILSASSPVGKLAFLSKVYRVRQIIAANAVFKSSICVTLIHISSKPMHMANALG
jgi:hypothetical protein